MLTTTKQGIEEVFENNQLYTIKRIIINAGESYPLQYHKEKTVTLLVINGSLSVSVNKEASKDDNDMEVKTLYFNDKITILPETVYKVTNSSGQQISAFFEVSAPPVDDDIVVIRKEDE
jgi:mannose-6-phosphate isomerase-like protein (cupin superfamily)